MKVRFSNGDRDDDSLIMYPVGKTLRSSVYPKTKTLHVCDLHGRFNNGIQEKRDRFMCNYLTNQVVKKRFIWAINHMELRLMMTMIAFMLPTFNYDTNGPAPHHVSECGGRNGYLTVIDMSTLELYQKKLF